jgi:hypothetical protein
VSNWRLHAPTLTEARALKKRLNLSSALALDYLDYVVACLF